MSLVAKIHMGMGSVPVVTQIRDNGLPPGGQPIRQGERPHADPRLPPPVLFCFFVNMAVALIRVCMPQTGLPVKTTARQQSQHTSQAANLRFLALLVR